MDIEYEAGDIIPVTSSLYRVLHDPPKEGQRFETFYAGESFPPCPDCGKNVRYVLPRSILIRAISGLTCCEFGSENAARPSTEIRAPLAPKNLGKIYMSYKKFYKCGCRLGYFLTRYAH